MCKQTDFDHELYLEVPRNRIGPREPDMSESSRFIHALLH